VEGALGVGWCGRLNNSLFLSFEDLLFNFSKIVEKNNCSQNPLPFNLHLASISMNFGKAQNVGTFKTS